MRALLLATIVIYGANRIAMADHPPEAQQALRAASRVMEYQNSIQFESQSTWLLSKSMQRNLAAVGDRFTHELRFAESGGQFRAEADLPDVRTGKASRVISARNATHYQLFQGGDATLTRSTRPRLANSSFAPNPALMPFLFTLAVGGELSFKSVRDPRTWESLCQVARWVATDDACGYRCDTIEFVEKRADGDMVFRVFFARDASSYPVRTEAYHPDGRLLGTIETKKLEICKVEGGQVVVPLNVKVTDFDESGEVLHSFEHQIKEGTLKVNQPIAHELFTIPLSMAKVVVDADSKTSVNLDAPLERSLEQEFEITPHTQTRDSGAVGSRSGGSEKPAGADDSQMTIASPAPAGGRYLTGRSLRYLLAGLCLFAVGVAMKWRWRRKTVDPRTDGRE